MRIWVLAFVFVIAGCSQPDLYDVHGQGHRLSEFHEKSLVVNYWATWCGPCIAEIPELNELSLSHKSELTLVGINFDQPEGQEAIEQAERMNIKSPVLAGNPAKLLGVETPAVLPTTYIFAPGGTLQATLVGPQTEETILAALSGE